MARAVNHYSLPLRLKDMIDNSKSASPAHKGKLKHSIDFGCKEGTRLYASLGGTVVYVKDDSDIGGLDMKFWDYGNRIVIKHINAEYSAYEHLRYKGANVKVGQQVRKGQLIGYSGNTGFSSGPHLHFEVFNKPDSEEYEGTTLQISIRKLIKG